jgi:hypothetical protein
MPKCVKCNEFLPPNYVEVIPNSQPMADGEYPKVCVFCQKMISEVERETEQGSGKFVAYTKAQCVKDYKAFIDKLVRVGILMIDKTKTMSGIKFEK